MTQPRDPTLAELFIPPLEATGVSYYVTGGYAAIMYGEARLTTDIDLVVSLGRREIPRLHDAFSPDMFYVPPVEMMLDEAARPEHGHCKIRPANIVHNDSGLRADVYVAADSDLEAWAMEFRRRLDADVGPIWVAPPEYVIAHKLTYRRSGASEKHVRDIRAMLAMSGDSIDRRLLARLVAQLGVRAQWDEVIGDAR